MRQRLGLKYSTNNIKTHRMETKMSMTKTQSTAKMNETQKGDQNDYNYD